MVGTLKQAELVVDGGGGWVPAHVPARLCLGKNDSLCGGLVGARPAAARRA